MPKRVLSLFFLCCIIFLTACSSEDLTGQAITDIDSELEEEIANDLEKEVKDEVTEKFNNLVHNVDSDEPLEEVTVTVTGEDVIEVEQDIPEPQAPTDLIEVTPEEEPEPETNLRERTVVMKNNEITPIELYIKVGDTVTWENAEEKKAHMVGSIYSQEFRSPRFNPGESFSHTFTEPGEYKYIDVIVPDKIRGKIIVE